MPSSGFDAQGSGGAPAGERFPVRLALDAQRCLNARFHGAGCALCAAACPAEAIELEEGLPAWDEQRCAACGLCLALCPSETFVPLSGWSETAFAQFVADLDAPACELLCGRGAPVAPTDAQSKLVRAPLCLGAFSPGLWFALAGLSPITVDLQNCAACPLATNEGAISENIARAGEWLATTGQGDRLRVRKEGGAASKKAVPDAYTFGQTLTRRAFLRSLGQAGGALGLGLISDAVGSVLGGAGRPAAKPAPHLPAWRGHLAKAYPAPERQAQPAVWPELVAGDSCSLCAACAQYCPAGALALDVHADAYALSFTPGACLDCGICVQACPIAVLALSAAPDSAPFAPRALLQGAVSFCPRCGAPTRADGGELCYWCTQEPSAEELLADARRMLIGAG